MKITLLGTGTSQGVPVIGCRCDACTSVDTRDKRLRSGVLIEKDDANILIDTGPDLRYQMLKNDVHRIDAILYTHEHNDHIIGLDDIRPFNFSQKIDMPLYAMPRVAAELMARFDYIFKESPYPGVPRAILNVVHDTTPFSVGGVSIQPINVLHGRLPILGYRFGNFSFITDASYLDQSALDLLAGTKVLVINALQKEDHFSHFTMHQAIDVIKVLNPTTAYLTHISHRMGRTSEWEAELPYNVFPAFDGLEISI